MDKRTSVLTMVTLAAAASKAFAVVNVTSFQQSVNVDIGNGAFTDGAVAVAPGLFTDDVFADDDPTTSGLARATQYSKIQPLYMGGEGQAEMFGSGSAPATADSFFDVFFDLSIPHAYTLSGFVAGPNGFVQESVFGDGTATSFFTLTKGAATIIDYQAPSNFFTLMSGAGVLAPGSYHLSARATTDIEGHTDGFFSDGAGFNFVLNLVERPPGVPEPLTPALLALAGGSLAMRRWRGGRSS